MQIFLNICASEIQKRTSIFDEFREFSQDEIHEWYVQVYRRKRSEFRSPVSFDQLINSRLEGVQALVNS